MLPTNINAKCNINISSIVHSVSFCLSLSVCARYKTLDFSSKTGGGMAYGSSVKTKSLVVKFEVSN